MNGATAQIVALTCHGNGYVKNGKAAPFFPSNSTCKFCDRINFAVVKKNWFGRTKEREVAQTPDDWFEYLGSIKAKALRLVYSSQNDPNISDRMSAGFVGGGGSWSLEVLLPDSASEYWLSRWEVWNQEAPEQRIWRVTYGMVSRGKTSDDNMPSLKSVLASLEKSLEEIRSFSERNNCEGFTQSFAKALDTIRSGKKQGYHQDISPAGLLSKDAEVILDACQSAWVFGGMGSWNDMGFEDAEQLEYQRVSDQLFNTINSAIVAVTSRG
jgi:hypothetical protein